MNASGASSPGDRGLYGPLIDDLLHRDPFFVLADFRAYAECQRLIDAAWRAPACWVRSAICVIRGIVITETAAS